MKKSTKKQIQTKSKKKVDYIEGLKQLVNYVTNPNPSQLSKIVNFYKYDQYIIKRLFTYVYFNPKIIHYLNKYFNDTYVWSSLFQGKNSKENIIKFINNFALILKLNNIDNKKYLVYLKSDFNKDKNRDKIITLLDVYFKTIFNKYYNQIELNFFYKLFQLNVINDVDIMKIDQLINNKTTIDIEPQNQQLLLIKENKNFSKEISNFVQTFFDNKLINDNCKKCRLNKSKLVVLDTNINKIEPIDLMFVGINPGKTEAEVGLPFVGVSGKKLREKISLLPKNVKWLITNVVMCSTNSASEIPNETYSYCINNFKKIFETFKSSYIILLGADVLNIFNINGKITTLSGKIVDKKIIPVIHPSSLRNEKMINIWNKSFENIYKLFDSKDRIKSSSVVQPKIEKKLDTSNLTFFDVKEIENNKILKIFIDSKGKKKYLIEDNIVSVKIINSPFNKCSMITNNDENDININISMNKKYYIEKLLREKLSQLSTF